MAVPGYHISGLDILGKGHGHYAIHNFVKQIETATDRLSLSVCQPNRCNNEVMLVVLA